MMLSLPPSHLRVAEAIRAGASSAPEIAAATGVSIIRISNVLRAIGDMLGVERLSTRDGRLCDRAAVIEAVRQVDRFQLRVVESDRSSVLGRDCVPEEPPGIRWPSYGPHELRFKRRVA